MIVDPWGMAVGALIALGLLLAVYAVRPNRPSLTRNLQRAHAPTPVAAPSSRSSSSRDLVDRVGDRLVDAPWVSRRLPSHDMRLLGVKPAQLMGRAALYGLIGVAMPQLFLGLLALMGVSLPFVLPSAASLLLGLFLAGTTFNEVRTQARERRAEYRYAVASLLERAALARLSGAGAAEALYRAAAHGEGAALDGMREVVEHARRSGTSPWRALEAFGREIAVPELSRPAQTFRLAGEEGATVYTTLMHQAGELRSTMITDARAEANQASDRMTLPTLVQAFTVLLILGYPMYARILSS